MFPAHHAFSSSLYHNADDNSRFHLAVVHLGSRLDAIFRHQTIRCVVAPFTETPSVMGAGATYCKWKQEEYDGPPIILAFTGKIRGATKIEGPLILTEYQGSEQKMPQVVFC
eukprot:GEMP01097700.1.p4 GENE.GEMP01097700.1~~GEMP01097700.1.p4  ORF type:complete len:112 (+),score=16.93 GEMP01097700.1:424-759(+)